MSKELLRFSYSKMATYQECPCRYKFKYIDKIPGVQRYYFAFGSAIHAALEFLHKTKPSPSAKELEEVFVKDWLSKDYRDAGYPSDDRYMEALRVGKEMLANYHKKYATREAFLVEYSTDVEVDGLKVRIVADKLEHLGGGKLRIVDYKTGKNVVRSPGQLMMYQKIVELDKKLLAIAQEAFGKKIKKLSVAETLYLHVPTLEEHPFKRISAKEIKSFWDEALKVAKGIRAEKFPTNKGEKQCKWCEYKGRCEAWKNDGPEL